VKLVTESLETFGADVIKLNVSVADRTAYVEHFSTLEARTMVEALNAKSLGASLLERGEQGDEVQRCSKRECFGVVHVLGQVTLFVCGFAFPVGATEGNFTFLVCIACSYALFKKAYIACLSLRANVEFLMATAMLGSLAQGSFREAASVGVIVTLMDTVVWASQMQVDRLLNNSMSVPPSTLSLKDGSTIETSELKEGMVFIVRAGDGIPADGTVVKGKGAVDESRVTGEAMPVAKEVNAKVYSGAVLQSGFLEVNADKDVDASFQAKVLESVKQAKNSVSNTQVVVGKFAAWYTPTVILIAAAVAAAQEDFKQFLIIIVAGCPCALLGAAPFVQAATMAILAKRHRFLVKEANVLESLARMEWIGIDKTGTITTGQFKLLNMVSLNASYTQKALLQRAAAVETKDSHPLAQSIVQAYTGCLVAFAGSEGLPEITKFKREGRNGVHALIESEEGELERIGVGNADFLATLKIPLEGEAVKLYKEWSLEGTALFVTIDDEIGGLLLMDDSIRGDSFGTVKSLKALGIQPNLLTGDKETAANRVARKVGIEHIHAKLLPDQKANLLLCASHGNAEPVFLEDGLLGTYKRGKIEVGFVGDGLNDCPALANANVGIVMQEVGSQATVDAASAVLQGDIGQIPAAIVVARRSQKLVIFNIMLALSINLVVIFLAASRSLTLWMSVVMDNGTLLLVLLNSLWPLCWRVEPVSKDDGVEVSDTGGKLAYRARGDSLLAGA